MYPILVLTNNIDVPIEDDFAKAVDYFRRKGINVSFELQEVKQKVSVKAYKDVPNYGKFYGLDDYVKEDCAKIVPQGKYRTVIFAWNTKDVSAPTDGQLTSWCNYGPLSINHLDTTFIQLITNNHNDKVDWIYKSIVHEIMHAFCANLSRFRVVDEMDVTKTGEQYLHNADPEHPDGNFARTFKNIEPFKDKLYEFYYYDAFKYQTLKLGSKGEAVRKLQSDLKQLGYFKNFFTTTTFGKITQSAVIAFQKANGLVADGIAGKLTLSKIEQVIESLKKKS